MLPLLPGGWGITHLALTTGGGAGDKPLGHRRAPLLGLPGPSQGQAGGRAGDAMPGVGPGLKLCGPMGQGSPRSAVQAERTAQAGIPASRRGMDRLGDEGPPPRHSRLMAHRIHRCLI